jgi:hypothetical protein
VGPAEVGLLLATEEPVLLVRVFKVEGVTEPTEQIDLVQVVVGQELKDKTHHLTIRVVLVALVYLLILMDLLFLGEAEAEALRTMVLAVLVVMVAEVRVVMETLKMVPQELQTPEAVAALVEGIIFLVPAEVLE